MDGGSQGSVLREVTTGVEYLLRRDREEVGVGRSVTLAAKEVLFEEDRGFTCRGFRDGSTKTRTKVLSTPGEGSDFRQLSHNTHLTTPHIPVPTLEGRPDRSSDVSSQEYYPSTPLFQLPGSVLRSRIQRDTVVQDSV